MRNYIIKRIAQAILILFCVMFIIYALIRCLPSSFAQTMAIQLSQAPGAKPSQSPAATALPAGEPRACANTYNAANYESTFY